MFMFVFEFCVIKLSNTNYMKSHKLFSGVFILALAFLSIQSFAQDQPQNLVANNYTTNKVRFVGIEDNMLVFDLKLSNLPLKGSRIRIVDGDNNVLFEHRTSAATYIKRFKIVRDNLKDIHFEVINKETILKESFQLKYTVEEKMEIIKA